MHAVRVSGHAQSGTASVGHRALDAVALGEAVGLEAVAVSALCVSRMHTVPLGMPGIFLMNDVMACNLPRTPCHQRQGQRTQQRSGHCAEQSVGTADWMQWATAGHL